MTLPILLEDQLTGASDPMAGRIPDTVSSGPWGNDPWFKPNTANLAFVLDGQVQSHGGSGMGLFGPLVGNPNNAFVELVYVTDTFGVALPILGVCRDPSTDQGIFAQFTCGDPNVFAIGINFDIYSTPAHGPVTSTPVIPGDESNFTIRLELNGRVLSAYVDGNLAATTTLLKYPTQRGGCYIESGDIEHFTAFNPPILAGGFYADPPPPVIGRMTSGLSNFSRLFTAG